MPPISTASPSNFPLLRDIFSHLVQPNVSIHTFPWVVEHISQLRKDYGQKLSSREDASTKTNYALWEMWYALLAHDTKLYVNSQYDHSLFRGKRFGDGETITDEKLTRMKIAESFQLKYQNTPQGHRILSATTMSTGVAFRGLGATLLDISGMGGYNMANVRTAGFPACCGTNISYNRVGWHSLTDMTGFATLFLIWQACYTKESGWPTILGVLPKRYYQGQMGRDGVPLQHNKHDNFRDSWWGRTGWKLNSTFINDNHKSVLHYVSFDANKQNGYVLENQGWFYSKTQLEAAFRELFEKTLR